MSVEIRPEFRPPLEGLTFAAEGKALADVIHRIHSYSKKQGLRPLTDFLDQRDVDDVDPDSSEWRAARGDWYPPAEGLAAVQALTRSIESDPKAANRWSKEDPDGLETLLDDLKELARCLEVAAARGAEFRLDLG